VSDEYDTLDGLMRQFYSNSISPLETAGSVKRNSERYAVALAVLNRKAQAARPGATVTLDASRARNVHCGDYPWGQPRYWTYIPVAVSHGDEVTTLEIRELDLKPERCTCGHLDTEHTHVGAGACLDDDCECADYEPDPESLPAVAMIENALKGPSHAL